MKAWSNAGLCDASVELWNGQNTILCTSSHFCQRSGLQICVTLPGLFAMHAGRGFMRIGIVVDSACDLPQDFIQQHDIVLLPITVRIGDAVLADHRDEEATLSFLHAHVAERGHEAETTPFTVDQIRDLFLSRLVIDYDYVFCMTITKTRSPIFENAQQASFAILNDYKPVRPAAGNNTPFALRVIDTQTLFAAQGITAVEAVRLRDAGEGAQQMRAQAGIPGLHSHGYMIPRDLYYLRARARIKGDRSVGLLSAALGSALDIKPVLHGHARRDRAGGQDQGLRAGGGEDVRVRRAPRRRRPADARRCA